jgi:hypothetical protein
MCCRLGSISDDICVRWNDGLEARREQAIPTSWNLVVASAEGERSRREP